jgi:hypothetical protein
LDALSWNPSGDNLRARPQKLDRTQAIDSGCCVMIAPKPGYLDDIGVGRVNRIEPDGRGTEVNGTLGTRLVSAANRATVHIVKREPPDQVPATGGWIAPTQLDRAVVAFLEPPFKESKHDIVIRLEISLKRTCVCAHCTVPATAASYHARIWRLTW